MNKRIKELVEQAGFPEWSQKTIGFELEKFAELIIKECVSIAKMTEPSDSDDYRSGRYWAGVDIKKHFGVEQ